MYYSFYVVPNRVSDSISATHTPNSGSSSNSTSCGAELEWGNISISFLTLVIYYLLLTHTCQCMRIARMCLHWNSLVFA